MAIPQEDIMAYDFGTTGTPDVIVTPGNVNTSSQKLARLLVDWQDVSYPELSVILCWLQALYHMHQSHHWISKSDSFYSDHLLFQRLYEGVLEEVDSVAEKSVGMGSEANVSLTKQCLCMCKIAGTLEIADSMIPDKSSLARESLRAELEFATVLTALMDIMKNQGTLTKGIDNLLAGICDAHETHVYLLKARCAEYVAAPEMPVSAIVIGP